MRCAALFVLGWTTACTPRPVYPRTIGNAVATPPRRNCSATTITDIAAALHARWGEDQDFLRVTCTPGNFPEPGYFVSVIGPDPTRHRFGVVFDDSVERVGFVNDPVPAGTEIVSYAAADLDGDGVDEILETWRRSAYGVLGSDEWVVVRRLVAGDLVEIIGPHLNVSFPNLGGCAARCELADGMLIVTVSNLPGIPPTDCLAPGRHVFTLRGRELVGSLQR